MTPSELAKLHLLSGSLTRPWSEREYKNLLSSDIIRFFYVEYGFLVGRLIGPDAEILNVIVHPKYRRLGKARYLIGKFEKKAKEAGSSKCFLEVAESNSRANKLYQSLSYLSVGKRKNYYDFVDGRKDNALILAKEI
jgi:ribosomal-protein-alanine N-acetyltransferase|tara:strand:+ start:1678 stop:2088 length:411 start_codon:yes stop_codon:yes gene_type:complete